MTPQNFVLTEESAAPWLPRNASPTRSLPEQIADKVGRAIIVGDLQPGRRVQEQHLAERFEVSRGPVREALRILEQDGLVEILPRRGAKITQFTTAEVDDLFMITGRLLGLAARLVALDGDEAVKRHIADEAEAMERMVGGGTDADHHLGRSYRLFLVLADSCDNDRLRHMLGSLSRRILRFSRPTLNTRARREASARNWRRVARCIAEGEADGAERAARQLVDEARVMAVQAADRKDAV